MMASAPTTVSLCSRARQTTLGRPAASPLSAKATASLRPTLPVHSLRIGFGKYDRRVIVLRAEESSAEAKTSEDSGDSMDSMDSGESSDEAEVSDSTDSDSEEESKSAASVLAALKEAASGEMAEDLTYLEGEILALTEQLNEAKAKAKHQEAVALAAKEQYLRSTADFENYRKRTDSEKEMLRDDVKSNVVTDFLPLVDNFELAGKQLKLETEGEKKVDSAYQNLYKQMVEIFKQLGVAPVETVGAQFDPEVHEAIMNEPSETAADGEVLEEFRRGFLINGKLIRPAMVKVAVNDNVPAAASEDSSSSGSMDEDVVDVEADGKEGEKETETK